MRSVYSKCRNYQRNVNFVKEHRDREPLRAGYEPLKSNPLIFFNGSRNIIGFQIELICFHVLLCSLWTDQSLKDLKLFNIPLKKIISTRQKVTSWLDGNLPYYPKHKIMKKKYHLLQDEINPFLKEVEHTGINLDIAKAEYELTECCERYYEKYGVLAKEDQKTEKKREKDRMIIETIEKYIEAAKTSSDGRIRCYFSYGPNSNRISTKQHSFQTIRKTIRHLFVPREGYVLLSCDITAQHLVIAFFLAKKKGLILQTRLEETQKRLYDICDLDEFIEKSKNK